MKIKELDVQWKIKTSEVIVNQWGWSAGIINGKASKLAHATEKQSNYYFFDNKHT